MKIASFILALLPTFTAFHQSTAAAAPAGYNSPIRAANIKDTTSHDGGGGGSSIHILEQQRHLQEEGETIICTRSNFLGNITTSCEEAASGIQSSCAVTPDGTCSYYVLDLSVLDELLANITDFLATNVTNSTDAAGGVSSPEGDPSSVEEIFAALFLIFLGLTDSGECKCTDSTPDCSMVTNLPTDYSFNACKADPKYSYTCTIMEQEEGSLFCCDIDDAQGKMKCCKSETDTGFEYECDAGSNTGKITLSNSSCVATYNGETCTTCDYCFPDDASAPLIAAYDCTEFGGSKRTCPDLKGKEYALGILDAVNIGGIGSALLDEIVDPRNDGSGDSTNNNGGSEDSGNGGSGASNGGFVLSVAASFAISLIVQVQSPQLTKKAERMSAVAATIKGNSRIVVDRNDSDDFSCAQ
eukprot:scaffold1133_cov84-Cylindrotheca_fusiformis.AAC.6